MNKKGVTAASPASYLLFDRSQEVGGGGVAGIRGEAVTARPLSNRHGPFPLCVPLLHLLHLAAIVQSRLAAEAPSLTLQKDYRPVKVWTSGIHKEQKSLSYPLGASQCVKVQVYMEHIVFYLL